MTQLWAMGAGELARLVRAREVSAREVVTAHLDRIGQVNPAVNAITVVLAREALRAADAADQALRRNERDKPGPLTGVPMTVKENIDVAGSATTLGVAALRDAVAAQDAPHIGELRAAGAIPLGRTNMPEFGMRWHTTSALRGPTRNPWSAGHTPGGSSGGDAAAVATGMTPLGLGNDGAGSLRWPAQCCGVAALKPSLGRVPQGGRHEPPRPVPFAFQLLAVHGPIARHVADLRLAFAHMCGRDEGDPWYAPVPLQGPPVERPVRVSVITDPGGDATHPAVAAAVRRAARLLAEAGFEPADAAVPALDRASEVYYQVMSGYGRVKEEQPPVETVAPGEFARFWAGFEPAWTAAAGSPAFDPMMERAAIARAWHAWLRHAPLVLAPVCTRPAFEVGSDLDPRWQAGWPAALRLCVAVNLLGLPAVTVPVGCDGGLPQAVQVIGPRFREDLCLDAAAAIEAGTGPLTPVDPRPDEARPLSRTIRGACPTSFVSAKSAPMSDDTAAAAGSTGAMSTALPIAGESRHSRLADLVRNISYEVMPFKNTERDVLENVPGDVPLTVTVTAAKGIGKTLDLAERLHKHGYTVAPHLPARQFTGQAQVGEVVHRLAEAGIRSVFVIGGDAPVPAGPYPDAHSLLLAMTAAGHPFTEVGIGGYPEGHASIARQAIDEALRRKAPLATRVLTQMCFDAATTATWAADLATGGVELPVYVGIPGPVNRQKLVRICAGIGLGQSARFLQKQQGMLSRFLLPGGYRPTKLARQLAAAAGRHSTNIRGLHIFTFNELRGTETWRQQLLAAISWKEDPS